MLSSTITPCPAIDATPTIHHFLYFTTCSWRETPPRDQSVPGRSCKRKGSRASADLCLNPLSLLLPATLCCQILQVRQGGDEVHTTTLELLIPFAELEFAGVQLVLQFIAFHLQLHDPHYNLEAEIAQVTFMAWVLGVEVGPLSS